MFSKDEFVPHEDELIVASVSNERTPNRCACSHRNIYHVWYRIIDVGVTLHMVIYVKCVCIYATCAIVYLAFFYG